MIQQDLFQQTVESGGKETETYYQTLNYIRQKCRTEGIDAALQDKKTGENLDALILFDRKGAGQQLAAQAGKEFQWRVPLTFSFTLARYLNMSVTSLDFCSSMENHTVDTYEPDSGLVHQFLALDACPTVIFSLTVNRLSDDLHTNWC